MSNSTWWRLAAARVCLCVTLWSVVGCARRDAPQSVFAPAQTADTTLEHADDDIAPRAVWVARWHYRYEDDIVTIMRNCARLGLNTVLWQVRGNGTVCYPSTIEPWSREFAYRDPGFDPLAVAVREAHVNGLRIEAWVNVMAGWRGRRPPPMREQLYHAHPDWFLIDAQGQRQPLGDHYLVLNPCRPEVRAHIAALCAEIAANYDLDGIHLDYVRYAWETVPQARQHYPRDPRTLALYAADTGLTPDDNVTAWDRWRANQLTQLVREIRTAVIGARPSARLTAAVVANADRARDAFFQSGGAWLDAGLIDAVMPMAYTADQATFVTDVESYRARAAGGVTPGIGLYKLTDAAALHAQLDLCRSWGGGFALFSYESLHATAADRAQRPVAASTRAQRVLRRETVAAVLREP